MYRGIIFCNYVVRIGSYRVYAAIFWTFENVALPSSYCHEYTPHRLRDIGHVPYMLYGRPARWFYVNVWPRHKLLALYIWVLQTNDIVTWEPEGRYALFIRYSVEISEGLYHQRLRNAIAPFWFSTKHALILLIAPFWLSIDDIMAIIPATSTFT